ncbi:MAG: excinuclease ABC subunit UvrC [Promethearchaeota archaeon]
MTAPAYVFNSDRFPDSSGVYLMKGATGKVLYVGKAKSLRKRIGQYFQDRSSRQNTRDEKIGRMVDQIQDIEVISTVNEREALLLENELIKRHQTPFNTRMRDDKTFPYIMITMEEEFPRIKIIRGVDLYPEKNLFFGPYVDKKAVRKTLKLIRELFPYCTCKRQLPRSKKRSCLYYHLKLCPGPCIHRDEAGFKEKYAENIQNIILFLRGKHVELIEYLKGAMEAAADDMDYERAARMRDRFQAMEKIFDPQAVFSIDYKDMDAIALAENEEELAIVVLEIRDSRLIGKVPFVFDLENTVDDEGTMLATFLLNRYDKGRTYYPDEILVTTHPRDFKEIKKILVENSKEKIKDLRIIDDADEKLVHLAKMGRKNAFLILHNRKLNRDLARFDHVDALEDLARDLGLENIPIVIEGYDVSNLQGKHATGSKVCFKNGRPFKNGYRRYKIQSKSTPDDYAMMAEIITRRFNRVIEGRDQLPGLVIIDGGKGQLNAALHALTDLGITNANIIGLAKKEEEIFFPGEKEPLKLPRESKSLLLMRAVRDESHRFAVKYHHHLRNKSINEVEAELQLVPSIGRTRSAILKKYFKTLKAIKNATIDELALVLKSEKTANAVYRHFHGDPGN